MIYQAMYRILTTNIIKVAGKVISQDKLQEQKLVELIKTVTRLFLRQILPESLLPIENLMLTTNCLVQTEMRKDLFQDQMVQFITLIVIMEILQAQQDYHPLLN